MSLLEDLDACANEEPYPRGIWELKDATGSEIVHTDLLSHNRWDLTCRTILRRGTEYVAVVYQEPCAEGELNEEYFGFKSVSPEKVEATVYV